MRSLPATARAYVCVVVAAGLALCAAAAVRTDASWRDFLVLAVLFWVADSAYVEVRRVRAPVRRTDQQAGRRRRDRLGQRRHQADHPADIRDSDLGTQVVDGHRLVQKAIRRR